MKRVAGLLLALVLFGLAVPLFAEYNVKGEDVFPVHRHIAMIYAHRMGYKIVFVRGNSEFGVFYVPLDWFGKAGGKGEIVWGSERSYPAFTAFYVDGEFSHIRLYLKRNLNDITWSVLRASAEEQKMFDVDTLEIEY
jgi:hypothetical protein